MIYGVGGKNNFNSFFKEKILPTMVDSSAFSKIAVVIDRDDQEGSICDSCLGKQSERWQKLFRD